VPYGKDAQLVLGYRGLLELGYRSGQVKTVDAFLIREGDTFRKRWDPDRGLVFDWEPMSDDAPPVGAIAFVVTTQGGLLWEHMTKDQILARRPERWQGTPWASWPDPMWLKTVLKSLYKRVRLSADDNSLSLAVESDETVQRRVEVPGMEPEHLVEHVPVAGSRPAVSNARNFQREGTTPAGIASRQLRADYREHRTGQVTDEELRCPECGATRRTPETLRVHRWLAHDVRAAA
jgi:recombinational DNA repair protein RecT